MTVPAAPSLTPDTGFTTLFWGRLFYSLQGENDKYDAWKTATAADADDAWFAAIYSGYVLQFKYQNTDNGNGGDALWKNDEDGNGWCIQDARESTDLGGYCLFPYQGTAADGTSAKTVSMSNANFGKLVTLWTDESTADGTPGSSTAGNLFKTNLVDGGGSTAQIGTLVTEDKTAPVRGYAPFSRFTCTAVGIDASEPAMQYCYKYQLRDFESEWTQGNVRFERSQKINFYLLNTRGWEAQYALFQAQTILLGGQTLAVGLALAAIASLSF